LLCTFIQDGQQPGAQEPVPVVNGEVKPVEPPMEAANTTEVCVNDYLQSFNKP